MDASVMKPWINSEVMGMVTEETTAEAKDNLYLNVNHDWLVNAKLRSVFSVISLTAAI